MVIDNLKKIVEENRGRVNPLFLRNLLKEALQLYVLNFVYSSVYGERFLLKGGSCLRVCFDLPRVSEDLDFDVKDYQNFKVVNLKNDLKDYFVRTLQYKEFEIKIAGNNRQLLLKFPIMEELGLRTDASRSNILFLRLDLSPIDSPVFKEEVSLKTTYAFSFVIKRYSLSDLFASKIVAIIKRTFRRGKGGRVTFKGRDYFDLIWFLQKGVIPNFERARDITGMETNEAILRELDEKVEEVKEEYLKEDLLPLFGEPEFVGDFVDNFQRLYKQHKKVFH